MGQTSSHEVADQCNSQSEPNSHPARMKWILKFPKCRKKQCEKIYMKLIPFRRKRKAIGDNAQQTIQANVIIPKAAYSLPHIFIESSSENPARISRHSLLSYALSKLAFFAKLSKDKICVSKTGLKSKFSFHKSSILTRKTSEPISSNNVDIPDQKNNNALPAATITTPYVDPNNNPELRQRIIKKLLSSRSTAKTPEELYKQNMTKFERLLMITADSSSDDSDSITGKCNDNKPRRVITTSKYRVEVDAYFLEYVKSKISKSSTKPSSNDLDECSDEEKRTGARGGSSKGKKLTTKGSTTTATCSKWDTTNNGSTTMKTCSKWESTTKGSTATRTCTTTDPTTSTKTCSESDSTTKGAPTSTRTCSEWDSTTKTCSKWDTSKTKTCSNSNLKSTASRTCTSTTRRTERNRNDSSTDINKNKTLTWKSSSNLTTAKSRTAITTTSRTTVTANRGEVSTKSTKPDTNNKTSTASADSSSLPKVKGRRVETVNRASVELDKSCLKRGPCGRGSCPRAPPAYLDYGGAASTAAALKRGDKDPVMERLKNVDVVEELTYMVPSPSCCGNNGDGENAEEEDDCEYYAMCESCGELEPLPEEVKKKIASKKGDKKSTDKTPVKYSRRQRFNFKNKDDPNDCEDGPPFPYNGPRLQRCNSFDEHPVGKNPQIRRILAPEECEEKRMKQLEELAPDTSGMYKFDKNNTMFERQVLRTPTPIVLEVPIPRRLKQKQLQDISRALQEKKRFEREYEQSHPVCLCPEEAEPMYMPPIYGNCNPPCNPCCNPCYNPCNPCCNPCGQNGQSQNQNPKQNSQKNPTSPSYSQTYASYQTGETTTTSKNTQKKKLSTEETKTATQQTQLSSDLQTEEGERFVNKQRRPHQRTGKSSDTSSSLPSGETDFS